MNSRLAYSLLLCALILLTVFATTFTLVAFRADETTVKNCGDPVDGGHPTFTCLGDPVDGGHPNGNRTGNQTG
jgi:cation transporter-like permease